ncbi:thermonuclease family protein [Maridesulfovibrio hydrothermalis]|uniref:Nuclease (SNase domain protein) n=1 Tax=Maridesulfovibrio hydrothermalis AM13 = DSM 14728 TaxID=1121451 RepID=L0RFG3_9BACT|nr:thermonuclease family protein [Maridesulfovibrio hydrothermalis]CCO24311.1 Nuclease (SNase domain protein) [Maridesulfovibrio hydrothermalis AM13 = DSM 14728]
MFFVLALFTFTASAGHAFEGKVRYVIDGDTFILENNKTVRMASIDTSEIGRNGKRDQYYAREATDILKRLISGKRVRIEYTPDHKDHYKRIVGWVYVDDLFVNEYMVRNGAAFFYYHKNNQKKLQNMILQAQRRAYKEMKGFWPVISKLEKFNRKWIGNKRSYRCFPDGSRSARKIGKQNRVFFPGLEQAFLKGYSPARNTNIWPVVR